ncbi:MAG: hypothetical protein ACOX8K_04235 [Lachnospiraceae bacterium]|jgi:hypothetical protein
MNTRISVRKATMKWELRKRLEICWRPFLLMTAILAVHACMPIPETIQPVFLTLPSIIFVMIGWYFFLVYPITSLLSNFREPYGDLERAVPRPFLQTLVLRILLTLPICFFTLAAMNLESLALRRFGTEAVTYLPFSISFGEILSKVWRVGIIFPITAVFTWLLSQIWFPKKLWVEVSAILLFLILMLFHDLCFTMVLRTQNLWLNAAMELGYVGLLLLGAWRCYER